MTARISDQRMSTETQNIHSPATDLLHSHSINTASSVPTEIVISEDLIAGQRLNGSMSNVRRFFCLFVTFDLLFTGLLWLICIMLNGGSIEDALRKQIVHYDVHSSMFDIVMLSVCRFTMLLLFYALLYLNHWIVIAVTTAGTCALLICKVFVFDWAHSQQPVFQVLLVLASFVIAWSEAWFFDFRVIPQETHAGRYRTGPGADNERTPLVRNFLQALPPQSYTESVGNFYSPLASPDNSMLDVDLSPQPALNMDLSPQPALNISLTETAELQDQGRHTLQEAWRLLQLPDWTLQKQADGAAVHISSARGYGCLLRLTAELEVQPRFLLDELFYCVEDIPRWSGLVLESRRLHVLNEFTDITYQASEAVVVSCRDFVNLRYWSLVEDCFVVALESVDRADVPLVKGRVRAHNGPSCVAMRPVAGRPDRCLFQWLLNVDLAVPVMPSRLFNDILAKNMLQYHREIVTHLARKRDAG